jgi:hypothetical protein
VIITSGLRHSVALIALSAFLLAAICIGCVPRKLPTSEPGRSGLPTAVYDQGTPPTKWEMDPESLPIYPGSKQFGSRFTFITPDPITDVIAYYKKQLPDAEFLEAGNKNSPSVFKTSMFVLEISMDESGDNTLIVFKQPEV